MHNNLILENFDESFLRLPSLIDERKKAFSELKKIGIPNKKVENWKYTDLNNLTKAIEFKPGRINLELSNHELEGIFVKDFDYFINNKDQYLTPIRTLKNEGVVYLNISYASEAKVIEIRESQSKPLIINISTEGVGFSLPRLKIDVFPEIEAEIHLIYFGGEGFINQLTEINLQENSKIKLFRLNKSLAVHTETFITSLDSSTNISLVNLSMPENNSRFQVYNSFQGKNSFSDFKSVSIPKENCHDDFLVHNLHMSSNCESNVGMRSILNEGTVCSFQALVDVESGTASSKAEQDCKAILLHENASMNAKPEMKIFNDDVVCKHGTTIGALDKEQIFYLQSRGLDERSAEKIILQGVIESYISDESPLKSLLPEVYQ